MKPAEEAVLARIRDACSKLPETEERLSHGAPAFFRRGRQFLHVWSNHHGDGLFALWCASDALARDMLVEADPERFYVPPYVGHRGWLGARLDLHYAPGDLESLVGAAYAAVAPRRRG